MYGRRELGLGSRSGHSNRTPSSDALVSCRLQARSGMTGTARTRRAVSRFIFRARTAIASPGPRLHLIPHVPVLFRACLCVRAHPSGSGTSCVSAGHRTANVEHERGVRAPVRCLALVHQPAVVVRVLDRIPDGVVRCLSTGYCPLVAVCREIEPTMQEVCTGHWSRLSTRTWSVLDIMSGGSYREPPSSESMLKMCCLASSQALAASCHAHSRFQKRLCDRAENARKLRDLLRDHKSQHLLESLALELQLLALHL